MIQRGVFGHIAQSKSEVVFLKSHFGTPWCRILMFLSLNGLTDRLSLCVQLCEDLFQRTGENTDPDLTYSVEVNSLWSVHSDRVIQRTSIGSTLSPPPSGVLHGDLLWAGPGSVKPKVAGDSASPGASHPGSLRRGSVQTGCDRIHRHPGPDGCRQQSTVSVFLWFIFTIKLEKAAFSEDNVRVLVTETLQLK